MFPYFSLDGRWKAKILPQVSAFETSHMVFQAPVVWTNLAMAAMVLAKPGPQSWPHRVAGRGTSLTHVMQQKKAWHLTAMSHRLHVALAHVPYALRAV